uniref:Uncharacterized protein n=1 Tax=Glossina palpalis gambiensis TaxID=67801 RepID=A0A1B0AMV1_9MUSC
MLFLLLSADADADADAGAGAGAAIIVVSTIIIRHILLSAHVINVFTCIIQRDENHYTQQLYKEIIRNAKFNVQEHIWVNEICIGLDVSQTELELKLKNDYCFDSCFVTLTYSAINII